MRARWKLGHRLLQIERAKPGPEGKDKERPVTYFRHFLERIGLTLPRAQEPQRVGSMPESELEKAFAEAKRKPRGAADKVIE